MKAHATPLTTWLSNPVTQHQLKGQTARFDELELNDRGEITVKRLQTGRTRKGSRGRPTKARLPNVIEIRPAWIRGERYGGTASQLIADVRAYADSLDAPQQRALAAACQGIADAAAAGDAVQTANCALAALRELESIVDAYVLPHANLGRRRRAGGAHRGR